MKSYKVITGLNASPSVIKKNLHNLKPTGYNMDIDQMLIVAAEKLGPIIQNLMETSTVEHFISLKDCSDIKEISKFVFAIVNALESAGLALNITSVNVNMDKHKNNLKNPPGYVFVNTTLLLEIIELYNNLENLREDLEIFYKSIGKHSFVQTESGLLSLNSWDSVNPNKIIFKLNKPITSNISSFAFMSNEYIVMPSKSSIPLNGSKSQELSSKNDLTREQSDTRRSKSVSSVENDEGYEVKDVYGARKVLVKCIYDLQDVSSYLGTERKDVSTICLPAEMFYDISSTSPEPKPSIASEKSFRSVDLLDEVEQPGETIESDAEDAEKCCCKDCIASRKTGKECEDQIVICIKGCNETEGDVQIVIRQCPDCKKATSTDKSSSDRRTSRMTQSSKVSVRESYSRTQPQDIDSTAPVRHSIAESYTRNQLQKTESKILHNKDSLGSIICSDEEDEELPLGCSRIKLFETTNLCLQTDTGQEFVISLTVSPKKAFAEKISLADIFSDDGSKKLKMSTTKKATYFLDDRYIPLVRTKVCSSLDFDVTTVESKIRGKGQISNKNNKIVVQLQDFGTENLLRACRPAKCCRKAILNEKMKKCLPYSPSIRSLPLDNDDMEVINQSLQMSLQKVKNSTNLQSRTNSYNPDMYYKRNSIYRVMYFFVYDNASLLKQKLNYYIHLVNDIDQYQYKNANFNICYFGVENALDQMETKKDKQNKSSNKSIDKELAVAISSPLKWMKEKYNKYQEKPVMLSPHQFIMDNDSFITKNPNMQESRKKKFPTQKKKWLSSRIPVFQKQQNKPIISNYSDDVSNKRKFSEINDMSLNLLSTEPQKTSTQESKLETNSSDQEITKSNEQTNKKQNPPSLYFRNRYGSIHQSAKSLVTNNLLRNKRKKKKYYLPRSTSDMALSTLKQVCKYKSNDISKIKQNNPKNSLASTKEETQNSSLNSLVKRDSSKLILNYFTKVLYEMIMRQMVKDKLCTNGITKTKKKINVGVATENSSLQEIYRRKYKRKTKNSNTNISFYDLKAKQSQFCIIKQTNSFNNFALQTSKILCECKKCQTSNTLLSYILNSNFQIEQNNFKKELIFKQLYDCEKQNSCDEIENFKVAFTSDHAFSETFSDDFMTSYSELLDKNIDKEEALEESLKHLKETLEKYEIIKSKIDENIVNPIEYFVYHLCACEGIINKKPTLMQRILSKSKGLFSSVEKSVLRKHNNNNAICSSCGCKIANCQNTILNSKTSPLQCTCSSDEHNKSKLKGFQPCCNKQESKITSTTSITVRIKKSICDLFGSQKKLKPCKCDRKSSQQNISENMASVQFNRKNISTKTSTQKCGCVKCQNFEDDGTCCCSHCLGCFDKSFETRPENQNVGIEADDNPNLDSKTFREHQTDTSDMFESARENMFISKDKLSSGKADIETIDRNDLEEAPDSNINEEHPGGNINEEDPDGTINNTTAYFFLAPASQFFREGNGNPFHQYLLNFPNFNLVQVENPDSNFRR